MTIRIKHPFTSLKAEGGDPNKVRTSSWNAEHVAVMNGPALAGRSAPGEGDMGEISLGLPLKFDGSTLRALDEAADLGAAGTGTVTFDLAAARYQRLQVTGGIAMAFSNPPATGRHAALIVELVNGGSATVQWPAGLKWEGGVAPALTASGTDILMFVTRDAGTTWRGIVASLDSR